MKLILSVLYFLLLFNGKIYSAGYEDGFNYRQRTDSLLSALKNEKSDSVQIKILLNLSDEYFEHINIDSSLYFSRLTLNKIQDILIGLKQASQQKKSGSFLQAIQTVTEYFYDRSNSKVKEIKKWNYFLMRSAAAAYTNLGIANADQGDLERSIYYFMRALTCYKIEGSKREMGLCYGNLAHVSAMKRDHSKGETYTLNALSVFREVNDSHSIASAYLGLGNINKAKGNFESAVENYLVALKISEELGEVETSVKINCNMGNIQRSMGNYQTAIDNYKSALTESAAINNQKIKSQILSFLGSAYYDLGYNYLSIGNTDSSEKYFQPAIEFFSDALKNFRELNFLPMIASNCNALGVIYTDKGNKELARSYLSEALRICKNINDENLMQQVYNNLANYYTTIGNMNEALNYITASLDISRKLGLKEDLMKTYFTLSSVYENLHDYKNAYEYNKLYSLEKDSLFNEESSKHITEMQTKYETEKKEAQITLLNADKEKQAAVSAEQRKRLYIILGGSILLLIAASGFLSYYMRSNRKQKLANIELSRKNDTIHKQKNEIEGQKKIVEQKNRDIIDSIEYASRIQQAIIPDEAEMGRVLGKEFFVFHRQKDIIGGDFYWVAKCESEKVRGGESENLDALSFSHFPTFSPSRILLALADCTGHGVPGALLSMLGKDQLNELVIGKGITDPEILLKKLDEQVTLALNPQKKMEIQDGMDMAVIRLSETHLDYAGARRPVIVVRNNEVIELSPTSESIGGKAMREKKEFTVANIKLNAGDMIYLFTDGYGDQMGGEKNKKFKSQRLKDTLKEIASKSLNEQKEILQKTFDEWKGIGEQTDDVTVIGIRI